MTQQTGQTVQLRPLSVVEDGDEVLVGEPQSGTFVSLPAVGGLVVRALQRGATVEQAAQEASDYAGQPVDIPAFVATLRELGFVAEAGEDAEQPEPMRTAPIQGRNWLYGLSTRIARPLFGRVAWAIYVAAAVFDVVALIVASDRLWPDPSQDAFVLDDIGLSTLIFVPFVLFVAAMHECWHWLAGRAAGVAARFGIDRRMVFLVVETDLSQLWTLPRRQRYSPLLAGLALDAMILAATMLGTLAISSGLWPAPDLVASAFALWTFVLIFRMVWQCLIFLRTDMYAVLVTASGCRNLWEVKSLLLRRAFGRLTPAQTAELERADPNDLRVGSWFRWLWLVGFLGVAAWFVIFIVPVLITVVTWAWEGLEFGLVSWQLWYRLAVAALLLTPPTLVGILAVRSLAQMLARRAAER